MWGKLLVGAGGFALTAFLVFVYGAACEERGRLAERVDGRDRQLVAQAKAAELAIAGERRVAAAIGAYAERAAALKPIILNSHSTVERFASTPEGAARCLGAERLHGIDLLDRSLFPFPDAADGNDDRVPADAGASPG
ncbi:hypothetical protein GGQ80_000771 [Sphingomonas jinjuensis]|uniref:Uncharacterized protein n=1 Tax=Sphingomonas jinjuensis TaxID=535907 RepID=A0A840F0R4_9SPHN|nr:hypothetical protein [Sphingomonas jinjuensis]MBB4152883.1 hypothetical protein [Sphingomonas jinjuensis]